MTMHKALHPWDDVDKLYQEKKEEETTLTYRYNDSRTT